MKQRETAIFRKTVTASSSHDEATSKALLERARGGQEMTRSSPSPDCARAITMRLQTVTEFGDSPQSSRLPSRDQERTDVSCDSVPTPRRLGDISTD